MSARLGFVLSGVLFKLSLDTAYAFYLSKAFAVHFLTPFQLEFSALRYAESFLWLIPILMLVPFSSRTLSGLMFFSALVFLYIPLTTMFGLDTDRTRETIMLTGLAILVSYLVITVKLRPIRLPIAKNGRFILTFLCFSSAFYFLAISAGSGLLFRMNFNLDLIYTFRSENARLLDAGLLAYLNLWTQKVFVPLLLAIGLQKRSVFLIAFSLLMFLVFFGVTQHRMHLFTPALVVLAWYLYQKGFSFGVGLFYISLAILLTTLLIVLFDLKEAGAIILRRAFFVGASVTDSWIDYFSVRPKVFFADNLLAGVVSNQYSGQILPYLLGDYKRADMEIAFNAGLVASGFAQLGVTGVALYALILGLFVRLNNAFIRTGVPAFIPSAIFFLPFRIAWADSDLLTALLSHGIIVGTFAIWLYGGAARSPATVKSGTSVRLS